jgi:hypothetical protein
MEGARVFQELQVLVDRKLGGGLGLPGAPGVAKQGIEGARVFQETGIARQGIDRARVSRSSRYN